MSSLRWCTFLQLQHYNEKWMFSILHLNAPTLLKKSWPTKSSSQKSQRSFSVLGASETWLTNFTSKLVNITRYNFVSNYRKSKICGEVCIYSQNDTEYKISYGMQIYWPRSNWVYLCRNHCFPREKRYRCLCLQTAKIKTLPCF